jgi:hypothetical protein
MARRLQTATSTAIHRTPETGRNRTEPVSSRVLALQRIPHPQLCNALNVPTAFEERRAPCILDDTNYSARFDALTFRQTGWDTG